MEKIYQPSVGGGAIMDHLGIERLRDLAWSVANTAVENGAPMPHIGSIVDGMVQKDDRLGKGTLAQYGAGTIADALGYCIGNARSLRRIVAGKMTLAGLAEAHNVRAQQAANILEKQDIVKRGTEGAPVVYIDRDTGLVCVRLTDIDHVTYEGWRMHTCLADPTEAERYLRDSGLYSLRTDEGDPRLSIEVVSGAIRQARGFCNAPLMSGSDTHHALLRAIPSIAADLGLGALPITDTIITELKVDNSG